MKNKTKKGLLSLAISTAILTPLVPSQAFASTTTTDVATTPQDIEQLITKHMDNMDSNFVINYKGTFPNNDYNGQVTAINANAAAKDVYGKFTIQTWAFQVSGKVGDANIAFSYTYRMTPEQEAYVDQQVKTIVSNITNSGMTTDEKVKAIHDWVVKNTAYDLNAPNPYTSYGALVDHRAVCQGYAMLMYKMLNAAGIQNIIVEGKGANIAHAWNLVNIDNKWYHLDATFDDPAPDNPGQVTYGYYNVSDQIISQDHIWTGLYPNATANYEDDLKAKAQNNPALQTLFNDLYKYDTPEYKADTYDDLLSKLSVAASQKQTDVTYSYKADSSTVKQDLTNIYNSIANKYGISTWNYSYNTAGAGGSYLLISFKIKYADGAQTVSTQPTSAPVAAQPTPAQPTSAPVLQPTPAQPTSAPVVQPAPVQPTSAPVVQPAPVQPQQTPVTQKVTQPLLLNVLLDKQYVSSSIQRQTYKLNGRIYANDTVQRTIQWTTSDPNVLTVDQTGNVTFNKPGQAFVIAEVKDGSVVKQAKCLFVIGGINFRATLSTNNVLLAPNQKVHINPTVNVPNVQPKTTYKSFNPSVVTTDANGNLISVGRGTAYVLSSITIPNGYAPVSIPIRVTVR